MFIALTKTRFTHDFIVKKCEQALKKPLKLITNINIPENRVSGKGTQEKKHWIGETVFVRITQTLGKKAWIRADRAPRKGMLVSNKCGESFPSWQCPRF